MAFSSWRGTCGIVRPTLRPGALEELIRLLPDGIGIVPLSNNIRQGTPEEFARVITDYEARVAELAEAGVDIINPSGGPPFMVLGYAGERALVEKWEKAHRIPIFTSGMTHIDSMKALGVKRFVGVTYFKGEINATFARYFADAGLECLDMVGIDVAFDKVQELSAESVYAFAKRAFLANRQAQGIYLLGPGWRIMPIIQPLEDDCGVPVIQHVTSQSWDIQRRLNVRAPVKGFGRLVAELP